MRNRRTYQTRRWNVRADDEVQEGVLKELHEILRAHFLVEMPQGRWEAVATGDMARLVSVLKWRFAGGRVQTAARMHWLFTKPASWILSPPGGTRRSSGGTGG